MTLTDDTHFFACSRCRHTGAFCLEALWLVQAFARVQHRADYFLPSQAEVTTSTQFTGCGRSCNVLMRVRRDSVEVTAGMPDCCDEDETLEPAASVTAWPLSNPASAAYRPANAGGGRAVHAAVMPLRTPAR